MAGSTTLATTVRPPPLLYSRPHWYACHTRSRHEKRVEFSLRQRGIESYLPLVPRRRRWRDRLALVHLPLYPGYVFGRFTLEQYHAVLSVPGIATVVRARGWPTPIPDSEVENVRRLAAALAHEAVEPQPASLPRAGDRVRVAAGPFKGVEGIVRQARGRRCILVGIAAIGQGFRIDVPTSVLTEVTGVPHMVG